MLHLLACCRSGSGMEAHLSACQDGAGADDSGSECLTVAHTKAIAKAGREQNESRRDNVSIYSCNWVILYYFCSIYYMIYIVKEL